MNSNPFLLFLILILLILGTDPKAEAKMDFAGDLLEKLKTSTASINNGFQSIMAMEEDFKANILNIPKPNNDNNEKY